MFSLSGTSSAVVLLTSTIEQQGTVSRGFDDWETKSQSDYITVKARTISCLCTQRRLQEVTAPSREIVPYRTKPQLLVLTQLVDSLIERKLVDKDFDQ